MTKQELSQLYYLNKEIKREQERLAQLRAAATDTSVKISGLPHASGKSDKTALAAEIADCSNIIEAKLKIAIAEYNRINRFINSIEDTIVRQIVSLRYINGLSWYQVECHIGGNNKAESLRKKLDRYLAAH